MKTGLIKSTPSSIRKQLLAVLRKDRRVTIPDVVAATGLPLDVVATALNELAYEAKAELDVSSRGTIYYQFPADLHFRLYSSWLVSLCHRIWCLISPPLAFGFRISFGVVLLFSLAFVSMIMLIVQLMMAAASGQTDSAVDLLKDYLYMLKRLLIANKAHQAWSGQERKTDQGFLLNCYSFLFGPPDPNKHFEAEQSHLVARLIQASDGIVLPEQMAPYTGIDANDQTNIFPFLTRFNGMPSTTPAGALVYLFPDFQASGGDLIASRSAGDGPVVNQSYSLPSKLTLKPLVFAGIGREAVIQTIILASVNFFGTVFFWWLLFLARSTSISAANLFLVLAVYAAFFLVYPALRWLRLSFKNAEFRKYNARIEKFARVIEEPAPDYAAKAEEVEKMRSEASAGMPLDRLVYTTKRDYLEQEADRLKEPM